MKQNITFQETFVCAFQIRFNFIVNMFYSMHLNGAILTRTSEDFINDLFEIALQSETINTNIGTNNFKAIDGVSHNFAIQTTFQTNTNKLYSTVRSYRRNGFYRELQVNNDIYNDVRTLYIVTLGNVKFNNTTITRARDESNRLFDVQIYTPYNIVQLFMELSYDVKLEIIEFLERYIKEKTQYNCQYLFGYNIYSSYGNKASFDKLFFSAKVKSSEKGYRNYAHKFFNTFYNEDIINFRERQILYNLIIMKFVNNNKKTLQFPLDVTRELNQYIDSNLFIYKWNLTRLIEYDFLKFTDEKWVLSFPDNYLSLGNDILAFPYENGFACYIYKVFVQKDCSDFSSEIEDREYTQANNF